MQNPDFRDVARQHPLRELLRRYNIKVDGGGNFCCPFHGDKTPSAHIFRADSGAEIAKCQSSRCGQTIDSVELVACMENTDRQGAVAILSGYKPAMKPQPIPEESSPAFTLGPVPEVVVQGLKAGRAIEYLSDKGKAKSLVPEIPPHVYRSPDGTPQGIVVRVKGWDGEKQIRQLRWDTVRERLVGRGWRNGDVPPLYNASALATYPDRPVLMVEGEKVVDTLQPLLEEYVLTCWQGGTGTVVRRDFSQLNGRSVTFWPDADVPAPDKPGGAGEIAMEHILHVCKPAVAWWLTPLEEWRHKAKGFDAYDLLKEGGIQAVKEALAELPHPMESEPPATTPGAPRALTKDWLPPGQELVQTKGGETNAKSEANHILFLLHHPKLKGRFSYDTFDQAVLVDGREMDDMAVLNMVVELCSDPFNLAVTSDKLGSLIASVARSNPVSSMGDRLRALAKTWDGKCRYLLDYAGVDPSEWSQLVSRRWGIGMAKRILFPGCQHDGVLVLEGEQGVGKTTFLQRLGSSLGRDLLVTVHSLRLEEKEAMKLRGKSIVDMSELTALGKSQAEPFKGLVGDTKDTYREPWGRRYRDFPRTCVFAGTTNRMDGYLTDPTGNRRIWPVVVRRWGNLEGFERDKEQIWAELAHRALEGEANEMTGHEASTQKGQAAEREATDPWLEMLEVRLEKLDEVAVPELYRIHLELPTERISPTQSRRVCEVMVKMGWFKSSKRDGYTVKRIWKRTST